MDRLRPSTAAGGELVVTQAQPADLQAVILILEDAARRAAAKGMPMWSERFPRAPVLEAIRRGEVYLGLVGGVPAATLTLQWSDFLIWGPAPEDAGYVHKLAVHECFAGRQLGLRLLVWAEAAVAAAGKPYLRLDCMAENTILRGYYLRAGYAYRGEAQGAGWRASLFEKQVGG